MLWPWATSRQGGLVPGNLGECGVLFRPRGHHLTTLPFSILGISWPAQSSLHSLMMVCTTLDVWHWLLPVLSRLGINTVDSHAAGDIAFKKKKSQTLPSAKKQLVSSSSSPGSFVAP